MPARIVVHDYPAFIQRVVTALTAAGHDVAAFMNTMRAIEALEAAQHIEVLITRVNFRWVNQTALYWHEWRG
jgi:CheY-like chemotaxis protein